MWNFRKKFCYKIRETFFFHFWAKHATRCGGKFQGRDNPFRGPPAPPENFFCSVRPNFLVLRKAYQKMRDAIPRVRRSIWGAPGPPKKFFYLPPFFFFFFFFLERPRRGRRFTAPQGMASSLCVSVHRGHFPLRLFPVPQNRPRF